VGVEMIQCTVSLFATVPSTLVHTLNFFISSARSLVLLGTRNRNKRVNLRRGEKLAFCALAEVVWFNSKKENLLRGFETSRNITGSFKNTLIPEACKCIAPSPLAANFRARNSNAPLGQSMRFLCLLGQDAIQLELQRLAFGHHSHRDIQVAWHVAAEDDQRSQPNLVGVAGTWRRRLGGKDNRAALLVGEGRENIDRRVVDRLDSRPRLMDL
jgi:hypothetical protein